MLPRPAGINLASPIGMAALAFTLCFTAVTQATAAPLTPTTQGKAALQRNDLTGAISHFEKAVQATPNSSECRLNLGRALCKKATTMKANSAEQTQIYKRAVSELRKAIRLGKGSGNAIAANQLLSSLPAKVVAPKTGLETAIIAMMHGIQGRDRSVGEAKPKVLEFYATWCAPCKQLKQVLEKAKGEWGENVEFLSYNVDDPATEKLVEDYEVAPIPTLILLNESNEVVGYSVGFSGEAGVRKALQKIVPKATSES